MKEVIADNKLVELSYKILDQKTGDVLTQVDYPIGYVHGANTVLSSQVTDQLEGRSAGDVIEVPIDCDLIYGPRDESLVITDYIENVPPEYREVGTTITMENDKGETRQFLVTRMDDETLTIDGNNPLCGRQVIFRLEVLSVRNASDEEIEAGGSLDTAPDIAETLMRLH